MKFQILLAVLGLLVCYVNGAATGSEEALLEEVSETAEQKNRNHNVNVGWVDEGNSLLFRRYFYMPPMSAITHKIDFTFSQPNITISAVRATEGGFHKDAYAKITRGGVNTNSVTVRFVSETNSGFFFMLQVWGY